MAPVPTVETVIGQFVMAEAPHWDADTQSLYFVDTNEKSIHKYTPCTKTHVKAVLGLNNITFIVPLRNSLNKFLISHENKLSVITWDGRTNKISKITPAAGLENPENGSFIWCDGKADPSGKLWAGAMIVSRDGSFSEKSGTLYNLETNATIKRHFNSLTIPNGLAWDENTNKFYFIDSPTRRVEQFDFDPEGSTITNRTRIFTFDDHDVPGAPDGMTIDSNGHLWIACFGGGRVIKIDPTKHETLLQSVWVPTDQVSSVAFGGKNLDELYVTTTRIKFGPGPPPDGPEHGVLYRIKGLGVRGLPGRKVAL